MVSVRLAALVLLMLSGSPASAADISFSCSLWGCQAFQERAEVWTREHGHRLVSYEVGWMADNLLGFYRQLLSAQSPEFDVLLIDTIWPGVLSRHLVDLRPYLPARSIEQHFKPIIDNLTDGEGRLVGMPLFTDAGLLYYRKDLLDKHGFAPPETWADLERIARVILEREADPLLAGFVWQGGAYEGLTCNALEWIDSYRGGTIIDDRGEITVNNPRAQRALEMARDWIGTISPREVLTYTEIETTRHFVAGHAIFMRNWMEYWLEEKNRQLERLSSTDGLTQISNRVKLDEQFREQLQHAQRYDTPFSILLCDVDFFKRINDTYGHQSGDQVLIEMAALLKRGMRQTDHVGRWGGEEFLVILPETALEDALALAERLRVTIAAHDFPGCSTSVTISAGLSGYRTGDTQDAMVERADQALYRAKSEGRNRVLA